MAGYRGGGGSASPTGAAGGDLSGSYPDPTVARVAGTTPTAAGLALLDDADAAAQRTTLSLVPGTHVASLSGGLVPLAQLGSGSPSAGTYLSGAGSWESGGLVPSAIVQGAPVEQAWSTGVAVGIDLGTLQDGDYSVRIWHWITRTAGGSAAGREATWNAALRRTGGVLSLIEGWTTSVNGSYAPTVTWSVSGDDVTVTITSSGSSGRISTQVTLVYRGDLTS